MQPLERRYYGNEKYRARERERRTRHPGPDLGYHIGPAPGGGDIALGPGPHVRRRPRVPGVRDVFNGLRVEGRRRA